MADQENPFTHLDLEQAIRLRWTMRDIAAKRWLLLPVSLEHLDTLIGMDLVEMRDSEPVLTDAGQEVLASRRPVSFGIKSSMAEEHSGPNDVADE